VRVGTGGVLGLLIASGCLTSPPSSTSSGGPDASAPSPDARAGCGRYPFDDETDLGFELNDGCDVHVEAGHLLFSWEQDNGGCWIEVDQQVEINPDGWVSVHYGNESDLSVVFEVYSPIGNLVANRWGSTFQLRWYDPGNAQETDLDSVDWDDSWRVWRMSALDDGVAVSAGPDAESLEEVLAGEAPFDGSAVGVLIGAFDNRIESLTATFDNLEICP